LFQDPETSSRQERLQRIAGNSYQKQIRQIIKIRT